MVQFSYLTDYSIFRNSKCSLSSVAIRGGSRIMNVCTSAWESWITRLWEKLNKLHVWLNCVRSRECRIWRFRETNFQKIFRGSMPPHPLYNSWIRGWPLVSPVTLVLNVQIQNNSIPGQKEWWYRVWMKREVRTSQELWKTRLSCHWENHL